MTEFGTRFDRIEAKLDQIIGYLQSERAADLREDMEDPALDPRTTIPESV